MHVQRGKMNQLSMFNDSIQSFRGGFDSEEAIPAGFTRSVTYKLEYVHPGVDNQGTLRRASLVRAWRYDYHLLIILSLSRCWP